MVHPKDQKVSTVKQALFQEALLENGIRHTEEADQKITLIIYVMVVWLEGWISPSQNRLVIKRWIWSGQPTRSHFLHNIQL